MRIILYSKPGCHLCEGLQEKLQQISSIDFTLEIRDITTRPDWFDAYQYEIPVLFLSPDQNAEQGGDRPLTSSPLIPITRPSPRATVEKIEQLINRAIAQSVN